MRKIAYNNSAFTIRLEYPIGWNPVTISGVTLAVHNDEGGELEAASACSLLQTAGMAASVAVGDTTFGVDIGVVTYNPGDRLLIPAGNSGPAEEVEVQSYNATDGIVTLKRAFRYAHSSQTVYGLFCTYDLDTSTVATWTKGLQVVLTWTPAGSDDIPFKERGEIVSFLLGFPDFTQRFAVLYPSEYRIKEDTIQEIFEEAKIAVQMDLSSRDLNLDRLVDTAFILPAIMAKARWIITMSGGDKWSYEREVAHDEYNRLIEIATNQPIWTDDNQDSVQDDVEIDDYAGFLGMERGF